MLVIKMPNGVSYQLDRKLSEVGGYGIWDFHRSACSYTRDHGHTVYRYARIKRADPAQGKTVEITLLTSPQCPEDLWIPKGEGVASIHPAF